MGSCPLLLFFSDIKLLLFRIFFQNWIFLLQFRVVSTISSTGKIKILKYNSTLGKMSYNHFHEFHAWKCSLPYRSLTTAAIKRKWRLSLKVCLGFDATLEHRASVSFDKMQLSTWNIFDITVRINYSFITFVTLTN